MRSSDNLLQEINMSKARNKVISGDYKGKAISKFGHTPFIALGLTNSLVLNNSNVRRIQCVDECSDISVASAATRGFIGELLFGPVGLAAAATAIRNHTYTLEVLFKDDKKSIIEVDDDLFQELAAIFR